MNVHVSYKACKTPEAENYTNLHIEKLRRRLQVFRPELVHLHATLEQHSAHEGFSVSVNLRLPSGQIAASGLGSTCPAALKIAFVDLQEQLSRHTARLRERYKRPHPRGSGAFKAGRPQPDFPFEDTVAAVKVPTVSSEDVNSWVNANLYRLMRFIERNLYFREANGQLRHGLIASEEVIDETIATALSDGIEKPERLALEPWLYHLAVRSIDELSRPSPDEDAALRLQQRAGEPNVQGSDEAALQFHQPDEALVAQDKIPDRRVATPEEIASGDEMISMVEAALLGAGSPEREAFLLYAIEGFTPEEIALISDRTTAQVRDSILAARAYLRQALPIPGKLKERLLKHVGSA